MDTQCVRLIVERKYEILSKIGEGTFGKIFKGRNINNKSIVAIKIEKSVESKLLFNEAKIYKNLEGMLGIPRILSFGKEGIFNYLVIDLLDESLEELRSICGGKLSLKCVLNVGLQLLSRIEMFHNEGLIHRDIKPDNFLIDRKTNIIYIIDFGLAKRYLDISGNHVLLENGRKITGTARYVSPNVHSGLSPSRRDDIESIVYLLIYLLSGSLPWQKIKHEDKSKKYEIIGDFKNSRTLFEHFPDVPTEFITMLTYCRRMTYDEDPDYDYLKNILITLYKHQGYVLDEKYDWNIV
jgi:serine/threonine protein kinase